MTVIATVKTAGLALLAWVHFDSFESAAVDAVEKNRLPVKWIRWAVLVYYRLTGRNVETGVIIRSSIRVVEILTFIGVIVFVLA
jgi:hypothetical protein